MKIIHWPMVAASLLLVGAGPSPTPPPLNPVWSMYQFTPSRNAVFDDIAPAYTWRTVLGSQINGALTIVDGIVYVENFDHRLYALDARDGSIIWKTDVGGVIMNAPIVAGNAVIVGTGTSDIQVDTPEEFVVARPTGDDIVALDRKTGAILWRYHTPGEAMATGVLYSDGDRPMFAFATGANEAFALDVATGAPLWHTRILGSASMASLDYEDGVIYGGSHFSASFAQQEYEAKDHAAYQRAGWTWAIRASDGQTIWTSPYGTGDGSPALGDGIVLTQRPVHDALSPGINYTQQQVAAMEGTWRTAVYGLDQRTGDLVWQYLSDAGPFDPRGSKEGAIAGTFADNTFFVSLQFSRQLAAFDAKTGRALWKAQVHGAVKMSPVIKSGLVYVGDNTGALFVIDEHTGGIRNVMQFPNSFTCSPPIIVGDTLYVSNTDSVYAVSIDSLLKDATPGDVATPK
jgi:eukaryotic-like serine/threonine-protein kinase